MYLIRGVLWSMVNFWTTDSDWFSSKNKINVNVNGKRASRVLVGIDICPNEHCRVHHNYKIPTAYHATCSTARKSWTAEEGMTQKQIFYVHVARVAGFFRQAVRVLEQGYYEPKVRWRYIGEMNFWYNASFVRDTIVWVNGSLNGPRPFFCWDGHIMHARTVKIKFITHTNKLTNLKLKMNTAPLLRGLCWEEKMTLKTHPNKIYQQLSLCVLVIFKI